MAVLCAIVQPPVRAMIEPVHELAFDRTIGPELVRNYPLVYRSCAFHHFAQKPFWRPVCPAGTRGIRPKQRILITGASAAERSAGNLHHDFVKVPFVARRRSITRDTKAFQAGH